MQSERSRGLLAVATTLILVLSGACNPGGDEPAPPADESSAAATGGEDQTSSSAAVPEPSARPIDPSRRIEDLPEGVEAAVPPTFPDDIAIYPGAEPAQGKGANRDGMDMSALQLMTGDSADDAFDFYSRKLEADGWTLENVKENEVGGSVTATKGDRKAIFLIAPAADGGADIFIVTEG